MSMTPQFTKREKDQSHLENALDSVRWTHIPGAIAWARRPFHHYDDENAHISNRKTKTTSINHNHDQVMNDSSSSGTWWPVILYPSWSYAIKSSGIFDSSEQDAGKPHKEKIHNDNRKLYILGCRHPVSLYKLRDNYVPTKAALGPKSSETFMRGRVVAHFLGLSRYQHHSSSHKLGCWGTVAVSLVKPFSVNLCIDTLRYYQGRLPRDEWNDLLVAVHESGVALERADEMDTDVLGYNIGGCVDNTLRFVNTGGLLISKKREKADDVLPKHEMFPNTYTSVSITQGAEKIENEYPKHHQVVHKNKNSKKTLDKYKGDYKDQEEEKDSTPEYYCDWTVGKNSNSQSQSQAFSQRFGGKCSLEAPTTVTPSKHLKTH